ncbi:hypothetical protein AB0D38_44220, partial [Streptomyces sp. NPDC048279]
VPAGFVIAIKASRYLTHIKHLKDPAEPVDRLVSAGVLGGVGRRSMPLILRGTCTAGSSPRMIPADTEHQSPLSAGRRRHTHPRAPVTRL